MIASQVMKYAQKSFHELASTALDLFKKKSRHGTMIAVNEVRSAAWTPRAYEQLAMEGYQKNVITYRCVNLIARGLASVPWHLRKSGRELEKHPLLDLLHRPNPAQGGSAFFEGVVHHLLLSGNAYLEFVLGIDRKPVEIYSHRPDRMRVIPGHQGVPKGYEHTVSGQRRVIPMDSHGAHKPVLQLKMFHPLDEWYGMSPLEAAACSIDQHNAIANHNLSLLQNGGRPTGAVIVKYGLSSDERETLKERLDHIYSGSNNAGRIMVIEGDMEWREMGLSPKDMDFGEGRVMSAREIAQAFGVPPMLAGIPGDATFANFKEARYHLWEDTILPLLDMITDELNHWIVPHFGHDIVLTHDIDAIPALAMRRESTWRRLEEASFLTVNEKRAAVGLSPLPDHDLVKQEAYK